MASTQPDKEIGEIVGQPGDRLGEKGTIAISSTLLGIPDDEVISIKVATSQGEVQSWQYDINSDGNFVQRGNPIAYNGPVRIAGADIFGSVDTSIVAVGSSSSTGSMSSQILLHSVNTEAPSAAPTTAAPTTAAPTMPDATPQPTTAPGTTESPSPTSAAPHSSVELFLFMAVVIVVTGCTIVF